jgi:hypothetical protein
MYMRPAYRQKQKRSSKQLINIIKAVTSILYLQSLD